MLCFFFSIGLDIEKTFFIDLVGTIFGSGQYDFLVGKVLFDYDDDDYDDDNLSSTEQKIHGSILYPNSQYDICQQIPYSSPQQLWTDRLQEIFLGSRLPSDHDDILHDLRAQLLAMISPKLPLSVKTLDKDWKTVATIMEKAWNRSEYIKRHPYYNDNNNNKINKNRHHLHSFESSSWVDLSPLEKDANPEYDFMTC